MLQAVNDKVIVELVIPKAKKSLIVLPEGVKDQGTKMGKVLAVGRGRWDFKSGSWVGVDCANGDIVYFGQYAGNIVKHEDKEYIVLTESEILAVEGA